MCPYKVQVRKSIHSPQHKRLLTLLRQIRTEAGLTQADLAARIHKDQTFVSKYESGERRLDVLELREICAVVGVTLPEFARRLERVLR
jgi:transcriptional regulator with XRE-family HTH domain